MDELKRLTPEREHRKAEFEKGLAEAQVPPELLRLIREAAGQPCVVDANKKLEDVLIAMIQKNPDGVPALVPDVGIEEGSQPVRFTFRDCGTSHPLIFRYRRLNCE